MVILSLEVVCIRLWCFACSLALEGMQPVNDAFAPKDSESHIIGLSVHALRWILHLIRNSGTGSIMVAAQNCFTDLGAALKPLKLLTPEAAKLKSLKPSTAALEPQPSPKALIPKNLHAGFASLSLAKEYCRLAASVAAEPTGAWSRLESLGVAWILGRVCGDGLRM